MCAGANSSAATVSKIDLLITPLNRNTADGMMDRVNALNYALSQFIFNPITDVISKTSENFIVPRASLLEIF